MDFDMLCVVANYLESHDLGAFRLVCLDWYDVYATILPSRCFKCLKHSEILYSSNKCQKRVCPECAGDRFYNIYSCSIGKRLSHKKRLRIMFVTYLEYPEYLRTEPNKLKRSYDKIAELLVKARSPFRERLLEWKHEYEMYFSVIELNNTILFGYQINNF